MEYYCHLLIVLGMGGLKTKTCMHPGLINNISVTFIILYYYYWW